MSDLFDVWRDWVVEHAAPYVCAGTLLVFMFLGAVSCSLHA